MNKKLPKKKGSLLDLGEVSIGSSCKGGIFVFLSEANDL
jgi:hypothetical protein